MVRAFVGLKLSEALVAPAATKTEDWPVVVPGTKPKLNVPPAPAGALLMMVRVPGGGAASAWAANERDRRDVARHAKATRGMRNMVGFFLKGRGGDPTKPGWAYPT